MKMKRCPFCGGKAELQETVFPARRKMNCNTKEQAIELQKEFESLGVVQYSSVFMREILNHGKWCVVVELKAFTPRCRDNHCPGRGLARYHSPDEAVTAWNRRADK